MMTDHDPTAQRIDDLLDAIAERDRRNPRPVRACSPCWAVSPMSEHGLTTAVYEAIGAASMCWEYPPTGVFDSDCAKAIGDTLIAAIADEIARVRADERERIFDGIGKDREITARVMDAARADERERIAQEIEALDPDDQPFRDDWVAGQMQERCVRIARGGEQP